MALDQTGQVLPEAGLLANAQCLSKSGGDEQALAYFLVVSRCGCFMQAARSLNIKPTLLRKKLAQLDARFGRTLFVQQGRAVLLSAAGRELWRSLQDQRCTFVRAEHIDVVQPLVRLKVAEAVLQDILSRDVLGHLRQHGNLRLDITCLDVDLTQTRTDTDILLWLAPAQFDPRALMQPVTAAQCLAHVRYLPYVAKRYSRGANLPRSWSDLQDYMLVGYQGYAHSQALAPWRDALSQRRSGVTQVNSYELMRQMIQWSACIGLLPHYVGCIDKNLQALPEVFSQPMQQSVWLAVSPDAAERRDVQHIVEMLQKAFHQRREWFR